MFGDDEERARHECKGEMDGTLPRAKRHKRGLEVAREEALHVGHRRIPGSRAEEDPSESSAHENDKRFHGSDK